MLPWFDTSALECFIDVVLESMQNFPGETKPKTKQNTLQLTVACKTLVSA